ncbi:MAG: hypothetical protein JWM64_2976 [Frankiales bacterium]|nr:hypothetical protein [Frankiales bacterium]
MTVLDSLRVRPRSQDPDASDVALPLMTRAQFGVLLLVGAVLLAGVLALVFGPARGMRDDIGELQTDLASSQKGIYGTLGTGREALSVTRAQLADAEQSLVLQQQGLEVAQAAEQDTTAIREQTEAALRTVREVTAALGPLDQLSEKVDDALRLARTALQLAQQTLANGQAALAVARDTLTTLKESKAVQEQLLQVARQTLQETREINRKIPGAPVLP